MEVTEGEGAVMGKSHKNKMYMSLVMLVMVYFQNMSKGLPDSTGGTDAAAFGLGTDVVEFC